MKAGQNFKMVIILNDDLPIGLKANTSAVLSLTLGNKIEGMIGKDLQDKDGNIHTGLTGTPLPILKSTPEKLLEIYNQTYKLRDEILLIDITDAAQTTKNYPDYEEKLKQTPTSNLKLLGIALAGPKELITKYTSSLGLLGK